MGPLPPYLLGCLAQSYYEGRCLVLLQLDVPWLIDTHGRPALLWREMEKWGRGGAKGRWWRDCEERREGRFSRVVKKRFVIKNSFTGEPDSSLKKEEIRESTLSN